MPVIVPHPVIEEPIYKAPIYVHPGIGQCYQNCNLAGWDWLWILLAIVGCVVAAIGISIWQTRY